MILYRFYKPKTVPSPNLLSDLNSLLLQLSSNYPPITAKNLQSVSEKSSVLLATESKTKKTVGMATLAVSHKLTTPDFGTIEDVVVDSGYRGRGIGKELVCRLITKARNLRLHHLDLTSKPSRVVANQLYVQLGFSLRTAITYRLVL
jgi:ribosomal protein S18 acetylase RimI-like enzyme